MMREAVLGKPVNVSSALARCSCHGRSIVAVLVFCLIGAGSAWATCAAPSPDPQCRAEFELFSSITWTGSAFVAVGHRSGLPASAWTIAVVDQNGRVVTRKEVSWSWPEGSDDIAYVEFKKILALPRNLFGLIGNLGLAHSN